MEAKASISTAGLALLGQRSEQQDSFHLRWVADGRGLLMVVADGMGGHEGGALASRIAADGFVAEFLAADGSAPLSDVLPKALEGANDRIARVQETAEGAHDMGTTLAAVLIASGRVSWISVGDSPIWLFRLGELVRLNEDHSLRQIVGPDGWGANRLQSALTGKPIPLVDYQREREQFKEGDVILVASDGMMTLSDDEIESVLAEAANADSQEVAETLLHQVEDRRDPSQDNCTLLVASMTSKTRTSWVKGLWESVGAPRIVFKK